MARMPDAPIAALGIMINGASVAAPRVQPITARVRPARQRMRRSGRRMAINPRVKREGGKGALALKAFKVHASAHKKLARN